MLGAHPKLGKQGYVIYKDEAQANLAIQKLDGYEMNNFVLKLSNHAFKLVRNKVAKPVSSLNKRYTKARNAIMKRPSDLTPVKIAKMMIGHRRVSLGCCCLGKLQRTESSLRCSLFFNYH